MRLSAPQIANRIWAADETCSISEAVEEAMVGLGIGPTERAKRFEALYGHVVECLRIRLREEINAGLTPSLRFSATDGDTLLRDKKVLGRAARQQVTAVIGKLHWRFFEKLCRLVLKLSGATEVKVTRGTKEGGVDIFGFVNVGQHLHPAVWNGVRLRLFCQVKKGTIGAPTVDAFAGVMAGISSGRTRAASQLPEEYLKTRGPIVGGLFSAKRLTRDAVNFALPNGFFCIDPPRITEILVRFADEVPGITVRPDRVVIDQSVLTRHLDVSTSEAEVI